MKLIIEYDAFKERVEAQKAAEAIDVAFKLHGIVGLRAELRAVRPPPRVSEERPDFACVEFTPAGFQPVIDEREACAKIADDDDSGDGCGCHLRIAEAIRARGR